MSTNDLKVGDYIQVRKEYWGVSIWIKANISTTNRFILERIDNEGDYVINGFGFIKSIFEPYNPFKDTKLTDSEIAILKELNDESRRSS